jgi:hypothetical protein
MNDFYELVQSFPCNSAVYLHYPNVQQYDKSHIGSIVLYTQRCGQLLFRS